MMWVKLLQGGSPLQRGFSAIKTLILSNNQWCDFNVLYFS